MGAVTFFLHRSNALEALGDRLAVLLSEAPPPPFEAELLVVQSRGMERWVSQHLARRLGVCANTRFLFPRNLVELVLQQVLEEPPDVGRPFTRESLTWSLAALLPRHLEGPAYAPLRRYLGRDDGGRRLVQLARRLADLFDQYVVYRPELVLGWEQGRPDDWQASLWRSLVERGRGQHLAARAQECLRRLTGGTVGQGLPERVVLFGISTLPPLFVRVLGGLAAHRDVHLLQLSPCQEYWADLRRDDGGVAGDGNPLLASLGRVGRDFQHVLEEELDYQDAPGLLFVDPADSDAGPSVLATLQSDVLHQRRRSPAPDHAPPVAVAPDDWSLLVHSCHGPMREAEVLRDQLLALFDADPTLEPRDVVVMTPDIATYAPYVDAAFGASAVLPYRIADRSVRQELPVVEAFLAVLDVLTGRFTASAVLDLMAHPAVQERFGFSADALEAARGWVQEAGVCWGVDGDHRQELGLPGYAENTWRFGLDRLLLAHALPADRRTLFQGTLPCGAAGESATEDVGGLAELCETLFELRADLRAARSVADWRDGLVEVLERTLGAEGAPLEHQAVREGLDRIADEAEAARFQEPIGLDALRELLGSQFDAPAGAVGFLSRGITVCELLPMRSIPFRVVALLGMSDDAYPRHRQRLAFDRIGQKPRAGDRSTRDDDRYQVLECLLAARDRLLITYVGQSARDGSALPPSVVVSELLDAVAEGCVPEPAAADAEARQAWARERFVVAHPLQPFSPRYFDASDPDRLFSYDAAHAQGARRLQAPREPLRPFVTWLAPPEDRDELPLEQLARFFANPSRGVVTETLGLVFGADRVELADREPMSLDGLARWQVGTQLLDEALHHGDPADLYPAVRAAGALPLGWPGRLAFDGLLPSVAALQSALQTWLAGEESPPLRVELDLEDAKLAGWVRGQYGDVLLRYRYGRIRAQDLLTTWIAHLARCATVADPTRCSAVIVGQPTGPGRPAEAQRFAPVEDGLVLLQQLVSLQELGRRCALRLFPETSLAYARAMRAAAGDGAPDPEAARIAASAVFTTTSHRRGEDQDPYVQEAHQGTDPLRDPGVPDAGGDRAAFGPLATAVFGPLLDHLEGEA